MCDKYSIPYPFGRTHTNLKNLVAVMEGWNKEIGMAGAYNKLLKQEIQGVHHRGVDDARNIAYILKHILEKYRKN
jgi:inhibitor of KinA sporulation pathway (predicted exonuclease)